ncbi:MAG TPA: hypothetical protein VMZ29_09320 [Candidatus Bathyarchaeia archaeon]|nr:hypothetical protein [Candidatus Bathyarchaeia archaeon]
MDWTLITLIISLIANVIGIPLAIFKIIDIIRSSNERKRKRKAEKIEVSFVNLKGKVSSTDSGGIITKDIHLTFETKNKSTTEETIVKITNAQLKVIADDSKEYDFDAYDKNMQKADFEKRPLELPKIPPKKSVNNHITFKYRNLPIFLKTAKLKFNFIYIDANDKDVKDETEWLVVNLE